MFQKMHILHKGSKIESRVSIYVLDLYNSVDHCMYTCNIRYPIERICLDAMTFTYLPLHRCIPSLAVITFKPITGRQHIYQYHLNRFLF